MHIGLPLAKYLSELGVLDHVPSTSLLSSSPECPIKLLHRLGHLDEQDAITRVAEGLGITWCRIDSPEVQSKFDVQHLTSNLSSDVCWTRKVVPLWEEDGQIVTAFANPLDHEARKMLEFSFAKPVKVLIAEESKIQRLLAEHIPPSKIDFEQLSALEFDDPVEFVGQPVNDEQIDFSDPDTPPIIKLCNKMVADAVRARASDIHIEPLQFGVDVRFRVDGVMQSVFELPKRLQPYVITRFKILAGMDIAERRRPQDGRIRVRVGGETIDLRTSSVPTAFGEKMVLRILNGDASRLEFDNLGLPEQVGTQLKRALGQRAKMLLVTGPTGSGKTTTLYTCLSFLKDGTSNIETVEDPIEYRIPGINQIQVNEAIEVTFSSALRSILRQDPDVIMIGEIRDTETAEIAIQAAQTGHLVLSTLHTNSAPAAITRLLNLGIEPYLIASSLIGIMAQRLVRTLCTACKVVAEPQYLSRFTDLPQTQLLRPEQLFHGVGCKTCNFTGYRGRAGIFSYLQVTEAVVELIYSQASMQSVIREAKKSGYVDLSDAAIALVEQGVTTLDEIKPFLISANDLAETVVTPPETVIDATDAPAATPSSTPQATVEPGSPIPRKKLVLIEDDKDVRQVLSMLLRKEMFEVIEAENGLDGLQKVYEHNPSMILCDLMMPVMDGREFLLKMRGDENTREIPVVMLTAADSEENETNLIDIGARDFVSKASSSKVMLSRLRRVLANT